MSAFDFFRSLLPGCIAWAFIITCAYAPVLLSLCRPLSFHRPKLRKSNPLLFCMRWSRSDRVIGFTLWPHTSQGQSTMLSCPNVLSVCVCVHSEKNYFSLQTTFFSLLSQLIALFHMPSGIQKPSKYNFLRFSTPKYLLQHEDNTMCRFMVNFLF